MKDQHLGFIVFAICIVAMVAIAVRHNLFRDIGDMNAIVRLGARNIDYHFFPDRTKPLSLSSREMGLRQLYPEFFNGFSGKDWEEFWDIIYGTHPLIGFRNQKLISADRNYSINEIQQVLLKRYPEAFSQLTPEGWQIFWKEIFGVIGYKMPVAGDDDWALKQQARSDSQLQDKIEKDNAKIQESMQRTRKEFGY